MLSASAPAALLLVLGSYAGQSAAAPERQRKDLTTWLACAYTCAAAGDGADRDCTLCLKSALDEDASEVGAHGLPASYMVDMLSLKLPGNTYTKAWCDSETTQGCTQKKDFPGIGTTSFMSWEEVTKQGGELPRKQNNGEVWRGNELGFIISNPYFWQDVDPKGLVLGATVKQHKVVRPIIDRIFGAEAQARWSTAQVRASIDAFFTSRGAAGTLNVQGDIKAWTHQLLYSIAFGQDISFAEAQRFVGVQGKLTTFTTISQLFPAEIFGQEEFRGTNVKAAIYSALGAEAIRKDLKGFFDAYLPLVQDVYGSDLAGKDCSPSPSCAHQLASALLDTFATAGGLSVPGALSTALGVLYSTADSNPAPGLTYNPATQSAALFYESMRMFAPVVGFPFWTTAPTPATTRFDCNGSPCANQYAGGSRTVLNLALAQRDHARWGGDAEKFTLKSMAEYHSNNVGFAEMAEDNTVAGGAMNRNCPAKELAVYIGTQFFKKFDRAGWKLSPAQSAIQFGGSTPFVDEFVLYPASTQCAFACATFDFGCRAQEACCQCASYEPCDCDCRWWQAKCNWKCHSCRAGRLHCNLC
jgi:hypothetical protein